MTLFDWSTSLIGYPAHRRSGVPVIGVSHCTVHDALRLAERLGLFTGWMQADEAATHLLDLPDRRPRWTVLAEYFVDRRVVHTEGPVGGDLVFAAAVPADGSPPEGIALEAWAESHGRPWLQVIDNEMAYFGGLDPAQQRGVLVWFCAQRPLGGSDAVAESLAVTLLRDAFAHGLTRNGALVEEGRRVRQQLWAGIHRHCMLDHDGYPELGAVARGYQLERTADGWIGTPIAGPCPLDDQRGRAAGHGGRA